MGKKINIEIEIPEGTKDIEHIINQLYTHNLTLWTYDYKNNEEKKGDIVDFTVVLNEKKKDTNIDEYISYLANVFIPPESAIDSTTTDIFKSKLKEAFSCIKTPILDKGSCTSKIDLSAGKL